MGDESGISPGFYANIYSRRAIDEFLVARENVTWTWQLGLGSSRTGPLRNEENAALVVHRTEIAQ